MRPSWQDTNDRYIAESDLDYDSIPLNVLPHDFHRLSVDIEGTPYVVVYRGGLDIERIFGDHIAFRSLRDDGLLSIMVDIGESIRREKALIERMEATTRFKRDFFTEIYYKGFPKCQP